MGDFLKDFKIIPLGEKQIRCYDLLNQEGLDFKFFEVQSWPGYDHSLLAMEIHMEGKGMVKGILFDPRKDMKVVWFTWKGDQGQWP